MPIARSSLVVGPAKCVFNGATFFTNQSFEPRLLPKTFNVRPLGFSQADKRDEDRMVDFDVIPDGRWSAAMIAALWPYLNATPGASMFGSADVPFIAHGADAALFTALAVAVTKMPGVLFAANKTLIGAAGFRGILGTGAAPDDSNQYLTYAASGGTFADSGFSLSAIKTQLYTAAWGAVSGFTTLYGEEGFSLDFNMGSKEMFVAGFGTIDSRVQTVEAVLKCKPMGPTGAQVLAALKFAGSGNALGSSRQAGSAQLTLTGADGIVYLTMPKATMVEAGYRFGDDVLRNGEIGFAATINVSGGTQSNLCTLAAS